MSLFVWELLDDEVWGTLAAKVGDDLLPLMHHDQATALAMRPIAEGHHTASGGQPIRLVRYDEAAVLETYS